MDACVLVVDDDREIVRAIALLLEKEGYLVLKAYDGMEALRILAEKEVQLIIMDVMMPKLDGLSAMMKIRERKNLPIIVLSARRRTRTRFSDSPWGRTITWRSPFTRRSWRPG